MSYSPPELEQIVREVLRRLRELEKEKQGDKAAKRDDRRAGELWLSERLVTLAALKDKLPGIKTIVVPRRAIITPAARDEIKTRNITLEYSDNTNNQTVSGRKLLFAVTTNYSAAALLKRAASANIKVEKVDAANWSEAVRQMTEQLQGKQMVGVILTAEPAAAACLANRNAAIRAAVVSDPRSANDAIDSLGANLLAIDPAAMSLYTLENILKEYAQTLA